MADVMPFHPALGITEEMLYNAFAQIQRSTVDDPHSFTPQYLMVDRRCEGELVRLLAPWRFAARRRYLRVRARRHNPWWPT